MTSRLPDEIKRREAVDLAVSDDPLARQPAVEKASDAAVDSKGRSTGSPPGQHGGNVKRHKRQRPLGRAPVSAPGAEQPPLAQAV